MANSLYRQYGNAPVNDGGLSEFIQKVRDTQRTMQGNPRSMVESLLRSGQMSQQQFNHLAQVANGIYSAMCGK